MNGTVYPGAMEKYPKTQEHQRQQAGRDEAKLHIHFESWMMGITPASLTIPLGALN